MKATNIDMHLHNRFECLKAKQVPLDQLSTDMKIQAISGFDKRYKSLNKSQCKWLKMNFNQTWAVVQEKKSKKIKEVSFLTPGEKLEMIYGFPQDFKRLSNMSSKLFSELKRRGFTHFHVSEPEKRSYCKPEKYEKVQRMLGHLQEDFHSCNTISEILSDVMTQARLGRGNVTNLVHCLEFFVKKHNPGILSTLCALKMSPQTYAHSMDVGMIFHDIYQQIPRKKLAKPFFHNKHEALVGGFLHDIGKSQIPLDIIESDQHFERNGPEMKIIQEHPKLGAGLLNEMNQPKAIVHMALEHHVKVNSKSLNSYPAGLTHKKISFESKLLAVADTYQALVGNRSYKKRWNPHQAILFLQTLAGVELDRDACAKFIAVIGAYPLGCLVELNDGSIGFVVDVCQSKPLTPLVALVKDHQKEWLKHNTLIDLATHPEFSIKQDLDSSKVLQNDPLQTFLNLKIHN